jgi:hypothetical protein
MTKRDKFILPVQLSIIFNNLYFQKAAGPAGYRTVGQCAARTMGKSLKEQALQ